MVQPHQPGAGASPHLLRHASAVSAAIAKNVSAKLLPHSGDPAAAAAASPASASSSSFLETHNHYSFIAVVSLMSLFLVVTISATGLLIAFCTKKNTVFPAANNKGDGQPDAGGAAGGGGGGELGEGGVGREDSLFELDDLDYSEVEMMRDKDGACYYQLTDDEDDDDDDDDDDNYISSGGGGDGRRDRDNVHDNENSQYCEVVKFTQKKSDKKRGRRLYETGRKSRTFPQIFAAAVAAATLGGGRKRRGEAERKRGGGGGGKQPSSEPAFIPLVPRGHSNSDVTTHAVPDSRSDSNNTEDLTRAGGTSSRGNLPPTTTVATCNTYQRPDRRKIDAVQTRQPSRPDTAGATDCTSQQRQQQRGRRGGGEGGGRQRQYRRQRHPLTARYLQGTARHRQDGVTSPPPVWRGTGLQRCYTVHDIRHTDASVKSTPRAVAAGESNAVKISVQNVDAVWGQGMTSPLSPQTHVSGGEVVTMGQAKITPNNTLDSHVTEQQDTNIFLELDAEGSSPVFNNLQLRFNADAGVQNTSSAAAAAAGREATEKGGNHVVRDRVRVEVHAEAGSTHGKNRSKTYNSTTTTTNTYTTNHSTSRAGLPDIASDSNPRPPATRHPLQSPAQSPITSPTTTTIPYFLPTSQPNKSSQAIPPPPPQRHATHRHRHHHPHPTPHDERQTYATPRDAVPLQTSSALNSDQNLQNSPVFTERSSTHSPAVTLPFLKQPTNTHQTTQNEPPYFTHKDPNYKTTQNEPPYFTQKDPNYKTTQNEPPHFTQKDPNYKTTQNEPPHFTQKDPNYKTTQNEPPNFQTTAPHGPTGSDLNPYTHHDTPTPSQTSNHTASGVISECDMAAIKSPTPPKTQPRQGLEPWSSEPPSTPSDLPHHTPITTQKESAITRDGRVSVENIHNIACARDSNLIPTGGAPATKNPAPYGESTRTNVLSSPDNANSTSTRESYNRLKTTQNNEGRSYTDRQKHSLNRAERAQNNDDDNANDDDKSDDDYDDNEEEDDDDQTTALLK